MLIAQRYLHGPVQMELCYSYLHGSDVNFFDWLPSFFACMHAKFVLIYTLAINWPLALLNYVMIAIINWPQALACYMS